jgi:hypothetical protein
MDDVEDDTWDEDWGEDEGQECTSLFSAAVLPSVSACCEHDAEKHAFDLREYRRQVSSVPCSVSHVVSVLTVTRSAQ